jgi:arylsulfatase A-like enzyme
MISSSVKSVLRLSLLSGLFLASSVFQYPQDPGKPSRSDTTQYNIIFILLDDQRYDAIGFLQGQAFLQTPNMDAIARSGAYLPNAYVTTALCSPSRASILTGQYAHRHRVVDNDSPLDSACISAWGIPPWCPPATGA